MKTSLRYALVSIGIVSLLPNVAMAARCSGLSLKYSFGNASNQIDVTNTAVGAKLYDLTQGTAAGTCKRDNAARLNFVYVVDRIAAPPALCSSTSGQKVSSDSYLIYKSTNTCSNTLRILLADYTTSGTGSYPMRFAGPTDAGQIYLNKKPPVGKTTVNPVFMLNKAFNSRIGEQGNTLQAESVSFSAPSIVLVNNASCSASVNNVSFGNQTAATFQAGSIAEQTVNISFSCNSVLPAYTLSFTGQNGAFDAANGIIKSSGNSSVGYKITWGSATVKPNGSAVAIGSTITPNSKPTANSFTIPLKVKPVLMTAKPVPGTANTALVINIKLN